MQRIACVDLPALPLQLARRSHPEWRERAVVVVDKDSPRGVVLWANERARRGGILPGLRYAAGLALDADLRATAIAPSELAAAAVELTALLRHFAPAVAPGDEPGIFWLDASGLSLLYPSLDAWAAAIRAALAAVQLAAGIAVGFTRFGSYATARVLAGRRAFAWATPADEQRGAERVPLHRIGIEPAARAALAQLGVHTVGQLAQLPEAGLRRRFGEAVHQLRQLAGGARQEPIAPAAVDEPLRAHLDFEDPVADRDTLGFFAKQLLDPLRARLAARGEALCELELTLAIDTGVDGAGSGTSAPTAFALRPAAPTLDAALLLGLVRLRLEGLALPAGARSLALRVTGVRATREQLALFAAEQPTRDLAAGNRALARLRASLGEGAVVCARLRDGHLPEAGFAWEPLERLVLPKPREVAERPLVRRIHTRPIALGPRPEREPDGWLLLGPRGGPVAQLAGPFCISGGWWNTEIRRDYYFAELPRGELCWIYYDRQRLRWYLHGEVA